MGIGNTLTSKTINTEVDNALNTIVPAAPTAGSVNDVLSKASGGNTFDKTTDSLEAVSDKVGAVTDLVVVPYAGGNPVLALLHTGYYHVHGASFLYPDKAAPVTLTANAAAWNETGTIVEIIPASTIIKDFDLHWCSITSISATLDGVIDIFTGAGGSEVKIGSVDVSRTSNFSRENALPLQIPQQSANARISARFTSSTTNADTVDIKLYGHVYSDSLT